MLWLLSFIPSWIYSFKKMLGSPVPCLPGPPPVRTHTHTHTHTHGLENKDQGVESLPAPPSHSHRASQDSALCCGGGGRHLPAIRAGMDSCYITSSGAPTMPGDGMLQGLATASPDSLWKNASGLQACQCSKYLLEEVVTNTYLSRSILFNTQY